LARSLGRFYDLWEVGFGDGADVEEDFGAVVRISKFIAGGAFEGLSADVVE
jgi:hypothetical protein